MILAWSREQRLRLYSYKEKKYAALLVSLGNVLAALSLPNKVFNSRQFDEILVPPPPPPNPLTCCEGVIGPV